MKKSQVILARKKELGVASAYLSGLDELCGFDGRLSAEMVSLLGNAYLRRYSTILTRGFNSMCGAGLNQRVESGVSICANCFRVTRSVSTWDISVAFSICVAPF